MTKVSSLPNISSKNDENIITTMLQIHEKIEQARVSAGLTQLEMAEKLGIKRSTYQYWEQKTPKMENILAVAKVLGLPKEYFLGGSLSDASVEERLISHDSLFSVIVSEIAQLKSAVSGEHPEVIVKKLYKAAEDVTRLGS